MNATTSRVLAITFYVASAGIIFPVLICDAMATSDQTQDAAPGAVVRRIGAIKAIAGYEITLTPDSGPEIKVTVQPTARIVRIAPGEKDLKNAAPVQLQDLQVGDRILVGGKASSDNQSVVASSVVVMTRSDLEARHEQERQDWQKRGVGGLVSAVDPAAETIIISLSGLGGSKNVVVRTSKTTVVRRYAPDSVKFDDAKPSTVQEIHPGDQLRARGDRSADGSRVDAEEIVSGSFRNIAGTVNAIDTSSSTLSIHDLLSKKTVLVKITSDSQLRQLPAEMAQRIAARLKRAALGGAAGDASSAGPSSSGQATSSAAPGGGMGPGGNGGGGRPGGPPDLQQMLSRMPAVSLTDLHKGDAVVIVATEGSGGAGTAITLLSGVEPILQAAPGGSGASILTPWSLSAPSGDAGGP